MFKFFKLNKYEKAFIFKDNVFSHLVGEGSHFLTNWRHTSQAKINDLTNPTVELPTTQIKLLESEFKEQLAKDILFVNLTDCEFAFVFIDEKIFEILPPTSLKAYWKQNTEIKVTKFNISTSVHLPEELLVFLGNHAIPGHSHVLLQEVKQDETTLLFVNGKFIKIVEPGLNAYLRHNSKKISFTNYKKTNDLYEITGQEILTKDKVSLRMNVTVAYSIQNPLLAIERIAAPYDFTYKKIQLSLREAVGSKYLDELLTQKDSLGHELFIQLQAELCVYGIHLEMLGLKDIILPGEMKEILNKVVEAEKQAQANIIRRREETAATRSLLNTAKIMEENSILLRLKELETLEKVTEKIDRISVYDGLDGLLNGLINIKK